MPRERVFEPLEEARLREFGTRVRGMRRARDLTQEQLAHKSELHRTVVGFIERGEQEVGILKVWQLAEALEVSPGELFEPLS